MNPSILLRGPAIRASNRGNAMAIAAASARTPLRVCRSRAIATALSRPMLANIEKRWEEMPPPEQAELWMALRDRMKEKWSEMTLQEKKAAYWIAFGPHGPRKQDPPDENMRVFLGVVSCFAVACAIFAFIRFMAPPPPRTMNKEWQEASNEHLRNQKANPITGISSPGYSGPGMVQSAPKNSRD